MKRVWGYNLLFALLLKVQFFCHALTVEEKFQNWLVDNGATLRDVKLFKDPGRNYRGLMLTKDLQGGLSLDQGLVMLIPQGLVFSKSTVLAEKSIDLAHLFNSIVSNGTAIYGFEIMVTGLMMERLKGEESKWGPCIDMVNEEGQLHLPLNFYASNLNLIGFPQHDVQRIRQLKQFVSERYEILSKFIFPKIPSIEALSYAEAKSLYNWAYLYQYSHGNIQTSKETNTLEEQMLCGITFLNHDGNARSYGPVTIGTELYQGVFITRQHVAGEEVFISYDSPGMKRHCNLVMFLRYGFVVGSDKLRDCYQLDVNMIHAPPTFAVSSNSESYFCEQDKYVHSPKKSVYILQEPFPSEILNVRLYSDTIPKACSYPLLRNFLSMEHQHILEGLDRRNDETRFGPMLTTILRGQLRILNFTVNRLSQMLDDDVRGHLSL